MGTMTFQLPLGLPADSAKELERTCVAGGPDNMPWPTELRLKPDVLAASRSVDESGYLVVPWSVDQVGRLMGTTATLMERSVPYNLLVELARGKVNQLRCQAADWKTGGLVIPDSLRQMIDDASKAFVQSVAGGNGEQSTEHAREALALGYRAAEQLVKAYTEQVFFVRHQRQARLDATLGCRLGPAQLDAKAGQLFTEAFNTVGVPMTWSAVEAEESNFDWSRVDAAVEWAADRELSVAAGPLIDFSSANLPAWLWLWERDLPSLATFMCKYVETAVRRYRNRVRRWQLTAASNNANVLSLTEEELLGLTYRLVETARQIDPSLDVVVGIAQPWGEYMAVEDRTHSPFIFADTLIRSGLNLSALDVELIMGVSPRGSYCRDLLETSRVLDLYTLLGVPLRVTLGYPSNDSADPDADPELRVGAGRWHGGFNPETQATWADAFCTLALCKPVVQGVQWVQVSDAGPHQFPHCGIVDAGGQPKPALQALTELRQKHLN
jgi:hypothetical protein